MTDAAASLRVEALGDVAQVVLNRPDRLNALTAGMMGDLAAVLRRVADEGARAVLITGAGRAFCSGASLEGAGQSQEPTPAIDIKGQFDAYYNPLAMALAELPVPLVTAVNGAAAGAGASIALAGDIIVAAKSSYFMLAFARIGLVPDVGATWLVARAAGRARALQMALLGERMPAEEALRAGLVTEVAEDEAVMERAEAFCARLAAMPTKALGLIRRQVRLALEMSFEDSLAVERDHQSLCAQTEDFKEGAVAFAEKRAPVFKGR
jgi:2-(1,2-epoxy-1,2-dihydrophenyl)acetyl-CoA isomerase